jgi:uncharacterized protein YndB with AHSA1/START domain
MKRDWTSFTKRITVDTTTRAIYNAWAIPSEIERWFLASAEFTALYKSVLKKNERIGRGDNYIWKWHGFPDGAVETGTIIEANGHNGISFTFSDQCIVEVSVASDNGQRVVELVQKRIPADDINRNIYIGCGEGWTFYLANLKSVLEGGIDLRNKNDKIKSVINS